MTDTTHKDWVKIQIHEFITSRQLSAYFQDGVQWNMDHKFRTISHCTTTVYIQDPEEALLFKLRFKL